MIRIKYYPYDLKFSEIFAVSSNARTTTELIIVELNIEGRTGYGQASYPPYMDAKREADIEFIAHLDLGRFGNNFVINDIITYMDGVSPGHLPAKAAIDMALYDLMGKIKGLPVKQLLGMDMHQKIYSSFTIGIGPDDFVLRQLEKAKPFKLLKLKLGGDMSYNKHVVELVRKHSDQPIGADFNQGLKDKETALYMIKWLCDRNTEYVEQPMPVSLENDYIWLKSSSPLDIIGDESIQCMDDITKKRGLFHGVNIKLMKCGGISKALEMVVAAKSYGLKLMVGCMAESSCAVTAAANMAGLFDRVDLDGHLNNANDPFSGLIMKSGELTISKDPGLGVKKIF